MENQNGEIPLHHYAQTPRHLWPLLEALHARFGQGLIYVGCEPLARPEPCR